MIIKSVIEATANQYKLDPDLVACIICQESLGNQWAFRVEWKRILNRMTIKMGMYVPRPLPSLITERVLRSCSFGHMQILGDTARDFGCKEQYLTALFDPVKNIDLGCKILAAYIASKNGDVRAGVLRYNGGGDKLYPDKVFNWAGTELFNKVRHGS